MYVQTKLSPFFPLHLGAQRKMLIAFFHSPSGREVEREGGMRGDRKYAQLNEEK